jgi:hypothetical protein
VKLKELYSIDAGERKKKGDGQGRKMERDERGVVCVCVYVENGSSSWEMG